MQPPAYHFLLDVTDFGFLLVMYTLEFLMPTACRVSFFTIALSCSFYISKMTLLIPLAILVVVCVLAKPVLPDVLPFDAL